MSSFKLCSCTGMDTGPSWYMQESQRHGIVTIMLFLLLAVNIAISVVYLLMTRFVYENFWGETTESMIIFMGFVGILNALCTLLLFRWHKIGFWALIVINLLSLAANIKAGVDTRQQLINLAGTGILFLILLIRKNGRSTWSQLK